MAHGNPPRVVLGVQNKAPLSRLYISRNSGALPGYGANQNDKKGTIGRQRNFAITRTNTEFYFLHTQPPADTKRRLIFSHPLPHCKPPMVLTCCLQGHVPFIRQFFLSLSLSLRVCLVHRARTRCRLCGRTHFRHCHRVFTKQ